MLITTQCNNVVSKVLHSKMLPYQSHVSEAEEKTLWLKILAIMLQVYRLLCMSGGLSSFHLHWLVVLERVKYLARSFSLNVLEQC